MEKKSNVRRLARVAQAIFNPNHYVALLNIGVYANPLEDFFYRYIMGRGSYPHVCRIRTGGQQMNVSVRSVFDMFTVSEIFSWNCYPVSGNERIIVDFGANIGLSMIYFLANSRRAMVFGFEPLISNLDLAQANLLPFAGRYHLTPKAVWHHTGEVCFGVEPTGRYSGIGISQPEFQTTVPCISAREAIENILRIRGSIDLLKIDVEGAEKEVLQNLTPEQLRAIGVILVEGDRVPLDHLAATGMRWTRLRTGIFRIFWP